MKNNKKLCSCILCRNVLTSNNLGIHYNSKQCQRGKLFSDYKLRQSRRLECSFCKKVGSSVNSITQHELYCRVNPNKKNKKPSMGMLGKTGSNQFAKAKKLGLPKPIVTESTREKIREGNRNKPHAYFSKEGNAAIATILTLLKDYDYGRIKSSENGGEFFLTEETGKYYLYDLCFRDLNIIVEYQGTAYHPKDLESDFSPPYKNMGTKFDVWNTDRTKESLAKSKGYDIEYIWSDNVENDIQRIVGKIKNMLTSN